MAQLKTEREEEIEINLRLAMNWGVAREWSVESRYRTAN